MLSVFSGIKKHEHFDGQRIVRFSSNMRTDGRLDKNAERF
jgi:hypothetical protein